MGSHESTVIDRRRFGRTGLALAACVIGSAIAGWLGWESISSVDADLVDELAADIESGQHYWSLLGGADYAPAQVVLIDRVEPTMCGFAGAITGPFYCPAARSIYVDLGFMRAIDSRIARAYVLAHELGHHIRRQSGVGSKGVVEELGSDCYAGMWLGSEIRGGRLVGDVDDALRLAAAVGDDRLCAGCSPETWTHGTAAQRSSALARGIREGNCK